MRTVRARPYEDDVRAFDVIDALGGFARLVKRSPTLDGGVPLRVAQACAPLLEGNAFGFQIELAHPVIVRRRLGRVRVEIDGAARESVARAHRACVPRLHAERFVRDARAIEHVVSFARPHVRIWTGLLVRAPRGLRLRVANAANRRNRLIDVKETWIDDEEWTPLVVDVRVRADAEVRLAGEIACVAAFVPGVRVECVDLADAPALGRAHAAFYDAAYFASKKREPTRKYRRLVAREDAARTDDAVVTVARVGPSSFEVENVAGVASVAYRNDIAFRALFDGHTLAIDHDARALAGATRDVEARWSDVFGAASVERDRRALWYLTKYFTPHPPGEPHFFLKPWTFTRTPPGWSCLLEGVQRDDYDVMRGVVSTDSFHATPAVFWMHRIGERLRVAAGEPLLRVVPVPRWLVRAPVRELPWAIEWGAS